MVITMFFFIGMKTAPKLLSVAKTSVWENVFIKVVSIDKGI